MNKTHRTGYAHRDMLIAVLFCVFSVVQYAHGACSLDVEYRCGATWGGVVGHAKYFGTKEACTAACVNHALCRGVMYSLEENTCHFLITVGQTYEELGGTLLATVPHASDVRVLCGDAAVTAASIVSLGDSVCCPAAVASCGALQTAPQASLVLNTSYAMNVTDCAERCMEGCESAFYHPGTATCKLLSVADPYTHPAVSAEVSDTVRNTSDVGIFVALLTATSQQPLCATPHVFSEQLGSFSRPLSGAGGVAALQARCPGECLKFAQRKDDTGWSASGADACIINGAFFQDTHDRVVPMAVKHNVTNMQECALLCLSLPACRTAEYTNLHDTAHPAMCTFHSQHPAGRYDTHATHSFLLLIPRDNATADTMKLCVDFDGDVGTEDYTLFSDVASQRNCSYGWTHNPHNDMCYKLFVEDSFPSTGDPTIETRQYPEQADGPTGRVTVKRATKFEAQRICAAQGGGAELPWVPDAVTQRFLLNILPEGGATWLSLEKGQDETGNANYFTHPDTSAAIHSGASLPPTGLAHRFQAFHEDYERLGSGRSPLTTPDCLILHKAGQTGNTGGADMWVPVDCYLHFHFVCSRPAEPIAFNNGGVYRPESREKGDQIFEPPAGGVGDWAGRLLVEGVLRQHSTLVFGQAATVVLLGSGFGGPMWVTLQTTTPDVHTSRPGLATHCTDGVVSLDGVSAPLQASVVNSSVATIAIPASLALIVGYTYSVCAAVGWPLDTTPTHFAQFRHNTNLQATVRLSDEEETQRLCALRNSVPQVGFDV